ncbi:MAG: RNA methyltransferase [Desulfosalsimonadaceae bacterium]
MAAKINLDNIAIVLHKPRYPENIGSAARAMLNMGIHRLVVTAPENYAMDRILTLATHAAKDVVLEAEVRENLAEAVSGFHYVAGTSARLGGQRPPARRPEELAETLIPVSGNNRAAIVFGPEDRGLTNEDLRLCHSLVTIPTANFSSVNLAQSVMLICHELFKATLPDKQPFVPRLATRDELDGMYAQMKDLLLRIDYIKPDNPDYWIGRLRQFFSRLPLRAKEVAIVRGIYRQVNWYARKCYEDGKAGRPMDPALERTKRNSD